MYSGSTLTTFSGGIIGAHQKIDRVARRQLGRQVPGIRFPGARAILHFEGDNGPDGIKRKSPAKDEPWHYIQPFDKADKQLIELIEDHYKRLVKALKQHDTVRSAFEAAWLSHAIVDGLTPAHHYPYEEKLVELRSGRSIETRNTVKEKILMPGESLRTQASNNWKFWGPKGLFTTHASFEWGVAMLIAPMRYRKNLLTPDKFDWFNAQSVGSWFREAAQDVARLELYDAFYETGWTVPLARRVRQQLVPKLICAVSLVWYGAAVEAGVLSPTKGISK